MFVDKYNHILNKWSGYGSIKNDVSPEQGAQLLVLTREHAPPTLSCLSERESIATVIEHFKILTLL